LQFILYLVQTKPSCFDQVQIYKSVSDPF